MGPSDVTKKLSAAVEEKGVGGGPKLGTPQRNAAHSLHFWPVHCQYDLFVPHDAEDAVSRSWLSLTQYSKKKSIIS
jgi:hypothetical protein